ncbi:MAG: DEAD/DEAH box helicase [Thermoproteota archaeon]
MKTTTCRYAVVDGGLLLHRAEEFSVEELDLPSAAINVLKRYGYRKLYPPQVEAIKRGVLEGRSVVVAAPTGAGKTLVALLATIKALSVRNNCKAVYMAPLKSIVYERAREWRAILSELGYTVEISTGDYDVPEPELERAQAILTTYEKLDSLLRHNVKWISNVCLLIIDEVHMVGDRERGPVIEVVIARLRKLLADGLQVIALSATSPNVEELATWLGAEYVKSDWRPVKLREGVAYRHKILWDQGPPSKVPKYVGKLSIDAALEAVYSGGQAIVFAQSRRKVQEYAEYVAQASLVRSILKKEELMELGQLVNARLAGRSEHRELNTLLSRLMMQGVAFHHAGLASYQREVVEEAFRRRLIKLIFATPTLAAGVNLPARRVIVDSMHRFSASRRSERIKVSEYKQMVGRAGRPGLDEVGEAVLVVRSKHEVDLAYTRYVQGSPEPVLSQLASERALRNQLLAVIASTDSTEVSELEEVFSKSLYAVQFGHTHEPILSTLRLLEKLGLVEVQGGWRIRATLLGKRVSQLYIDPITADRMVKFLKTFTGAAIPLDRVLFVITWNPDAVRARPPRYLHEPLELEAEDILESIGFRPYIDVGEADIAIAAEALYTSELLEAWIKGEDEDNILSRFGVDPGDLASIIEAATWLAHSFHQIALLFRHPASSFLGDLVLRVKYGVPSELVDLVKLPQIGRARAKALYEAGIRTLSDVAESDPETLAKIARGLGERQAQMVIEQARKLVRSRSRSSNG